MIIVTVAILNEVVGFSLFACIDVYLFKLVNTHKRIQLSVVKFIYFFVMCINKKKNVFGYC